ncbi:RNA-dependent RNA polymerase [Ruloma virus]|uniref:RNA-directed RNA polymerase L n=1 Tax=Ruloma virus TaxID=2811341 RepID=A0AAE7U6D3_9MONO|nr:RNA-dependent RNA polymerase [Ruloma virus]QRN45791.1 RNA-dependent RNA polymerase [Ruloma virus]
MSLSYSLSDVLYPEAHLNSPIVAGKLITMVLYADLPCNQSLDDKQILLNIHRNKQRGVSNSVIRTQKEIGLEIRKYYPNFKRLKPIPYPNGNKHLFSLTDNKVISELKTILNYGHKCYNKISGRLLKLKKSLLDQLGTTDKVLPVEEELINKKIVSLPNIMESSNWYNPFLFWFTIKTYMRKIIKKSGKKFTSQSDRIKTIISNSLIIVINRNLAIIIDKRDNTIHYLTFEMVLMFSDVVEGRLMIDLGMQTDIRLKPIYRRGKYLWGLIDSLFVDLGNSTYNIVALIEPFVLGFLQLKDESHILRGAFLKYCLNELNNELINNGFDDDKDIDFIKSSFFWIFNLSDIHLIGEFFSFFRTFGHPILEAKEAADKVRSHMNKPKLIDFKIMMKGHAIFCGTIINGYRERHGGTWPPLILPKHASHEIINLKNNDEGLTDEMCIVHWKSFVGLKFHCFMPLVLDDDLTMYMKDKALASPLSEWDSIYPKEVIDYVNSSSTISRRLIEVFIEDSEFDPVNLINYVLSGEYLRDNEFNLTYSLKEKEIKKVGRIFAKMTYKMRACQVLAESLIATGVGRFFKENGIVKDEHELIKTLHRLSVSSVPKDNKYHNSSSSNYNLSSSNLNSKINKSPVTYKKKFNRNLPTVQPKKESINLLKGKGKNDTVNLQRNMTNIQYETISAFLTTDLQKFCLNWRHETTAVFAERLNEIYGLPDFFGWLHKRLERSVLYVADPYCPPKFMPGKTIYDRGNSGIFIKYPMGGIEGFCQKLWTIITIPFLFLSAYEAGTKIAAVVQGDNEAIAITRRVHPNLPYKVKKNMCVESAQEYFQQLRRNFHGIGHHLKAHETIVSSHFFIYSKRIYYDGVAISQSLKPLSRAVFWSETIVDETRSACSNISTAIAKSIEQGFSRWIGYSINLLKTIEQIIISLKFTLNDSMTEDVVHPLYSNPNWILAAALVPSQLGGFNYMNMSRLYVRNIGDPVTSSMADIKRLIKSDLLHESILQKIMNQEPGNGTFLDWSSDPYSINMPDSQSVTVILKNVTARHILSNSPNPMLTGLFHLDFEQEDHDLATFLMDRPIIMPRAAHEIMSKTLTGARQEIAGMLDTTKGLIRNSLRLGGLRPKLVDRISLYDYNQIRIFNNLMTNKRVTITLSSDACAVQLAIALRKRMWFHLSHGRQIYGLEAPDILEAVIGFTIVGCENCFHCDSENEEYCWILVPRECQLDNVNNESNAMRIPYIGSTTDERSEIKLGNIRSASRALRAAVRIATVYTWAFGDQDHHWEQAWYLASTRANITLEELKAITPISTSTNIAHRLRDRSTQMKYSGSSVNRVGRYVVISNDNLNFVRDGEKIDTNLVYQQIMLLGISVLEEQYRYFIDTGPTNRLLHLHIVKNCCVIEMPDHPYIDTDIVLPSLQFVYGNKLIYDDQPIIDKDKMILDQQIFKQGTLFFPKWTIRELDELLAQSLAHTFVEIITQEDKDHLTELKVLNNDDDINSLITECLLVDPSLLTLYLGLSISIKWAFNIYYKRPEGKYQMVEKLHAILANTSKSYFTVIMNAFSHIRVLNRFWDNGLIEPIYGPNLLNQDYFSIVVDYLIKSYITYLDYWLDDNNPEFLITESLFRSIDQRYESVQSRHLCTLTSLYLTRSNMPRIKGLTSIQKCQLLFDNLISERRAKGTTLKWNLDPLNVIIYPASLTYLRRGAIKHIRIRKSITDPASSTRDTKWDPLIHPDKRFLHILETSKISGVKVIPYNLLFSTDLNKHLNIMEDTISSNSWEIHVTRRVGLNSTSCYKALEIGMYLLNFLNKEGPRLFLGEGSGAMLTVYYFLLGPCLTYYNSGVFNEIYVGQRILDISPAEVHLIIKNNPSNITLSKDLNVLFNGRPESTWVGNMECFQFIMNTIPMHSLALIHSDIENTHNKDDEIVLLELAHILSMCINLGELGSSVIIKLAPKKGDKSPLFIRTCLEYYSDVNILIPKSSNPYSSEVYLCCQFLKMTVFRSPFELLRQINTNVEFGTLTLRENILNIKVGDYIRAKQIHKRYHGYERSDLTELTPEERLLLSYGFQINGPRIIKKLINHDIAGGKSVLQQLIKSGFYSLAVELDDPLRHDHFFSPYPIRVNTKYNLIIKDLFYKIGVFIILYLKYPNYSIRNHLISMLRRKILAININNDDISQLIDKKSKIILIKQGIELDFNHKLETKEIKQWWKIVGYSLIYHED